MFGPETGEQLTLFISERSYNLVSFLLLSWWIIIQGKDVKIESLPFHAITSGVPSKARYYSIIFIFHHPHTITFLEKWAFSHCPSIKFWRRDACNQILVDVYFFRTNAPADIYRVDIAQYRRYRYSRYSRYIR